MYNNPYFQGFRELNNQQPIQNIINTQVPQNDMFMAKFLKENEQAESQYITTKTAFIDLNRNELTIRDLTGDTKKYQIIPPLDEKDLKINALEKELKELKEMINNGSNAICQSTYEIASKIDNCCCNTQLAIKDLTATVVAENAATRSMIQENKIESLQAQVNQLQLSQALCGIPKINPYAYGVVPMNNCGTCSPLY